MSGRARRTFHQRAFEVVSGIEFMPEALEQFIEKELSD